MNRIEKEKIRAVVFDMDGLMFDSERVIQYSWNVVGRRMGYGNLGDDNILNTLGFNRDTRRNYFKERYGSDFPYEQFYDDYRIAFREYVAANGLPVKEGLHELLEVLNDKGILMAVATSSGYEHALENLKNEGVEHYFKAMITGNMVTHAKPAPEIYEKACQALGVEPGYAVALEDSYNGIRSAHRAGMYTIMIPDLLKDTAPVRECLDCKMDSLLDVAVWLQMEG